MSVAALRAALDREIEALIELADRLDGDCDLEDDDPDVDPLDLGEADGVFDLILPEYGEDETKGMLNAEYGKEIAYAVAFNVAGTR